MAGREKDLDIKEHVSIVGKLDTRRRNVGAVKTAAERGIGQTRWRKERKERSMTRRT